MSEQKVKLPSFGSTNFASTTVISDAQGNMEGALFAQTAVKPGFQRRFIQKYGDPSYLATATQSYDMAHIICGLTRGLRAQAVINEVNALSSFEGESGKVALMGSVEQGRYFRFPISVNQIRNGKVEVVSVDGEQMDQLEK